MKKRNLDLEKLSQLPIQKGWAIGGDPRSAVVVIDEADWLAVLANLQRVMELEQANKRLQQTLALHENPDRVVVTQEIWGRAMQVESAARIVAELPDGVTLETGSERRLANLLREKSTAMRHLRAVLAGKPARQNKSNESVDSKE